MGVPSEEPENNIRTMKNTKSLNLKEVFIKEFDYSHILEDQKYKVYLLTTMQWQQTRSTIPLEMNTYTGICYNSCHVKYRTESKLTSGSKPLG